MEQQHRLQGIQQRQTLSWTLVSTRRILSHTAKRSYLLGHNVVYSVKGNPPFQKNKSLSSSRSKNIVLADKTVYVSLLQEQRGHICVLVATDPEVWVRFQALPDFLRCSVS
jgi:hypothetical protein